MSVFSAPSWYFLSIKVFSPHPRCFFSTPAVVFSQLQNGVFPAPKVFFPAPKRCFLCKVVFFQRRNSVFSSTGKERDTETDTETETVTETKTDTETKTETARQTDKQTNKQTNQPIKWQVLPTLLLHCSLSSCCFTHVHGVLVVTQPCCTHGGGVYVEFSHPLLS